MMADNPYTKFFNKSAPVGDSFGASADDVAQQVGSRLWEGVLDIPGMVGDADEGTRLAGYHVAKGISQLLGLVGVDAPVTPPQPGKRLTQGLLPTSGEFKEAVGFKRRKPTTAAGKSFDESVVGDIVEAGPGVLVSGPKKIIEKGLALDAPGVLKEAGKTTFKYNVLPQAAGAAAQAGATPLLGEDWGDTAKVVTELATTGLAGLKERPSSGYFPTLAEMQANPRIPPAHIVRTGMVDEAIRKASKKTQRPGRDIDTVYRSVFEKLQENKAFMKGSSPAERAAIDRVVDGGSVEKSMQFLGKKFSLVSSPIRAMAGIYLAYKYGGIESAMAAAGVPLVAKRGVGAITKRSAESAQTMYHRADDTKVPLFPGGKPAIKTGALYYGGEPSRKEETNPYAQYFSGRQ